MLHKFTIEGLRPLVRTHRLWNSPSAFRFNSTSALDSCVTPSRVLNAKPGLSIGITQRAANRLGNIFKDSKEALRVSVESGGCHGFQYNLKLIPREEINLENPAPTQNATESTTEQGEFEEDEFDTNFDVVFELPGDGGQVVIDEKSLNVLNKTILTYTTELIGSTFKITGGNMKNSCGCGSSFDVDV